MLKVGQKVRVVACFGGHGFEMGEEIVVEQIRVDSFKGSNGHDFWYLDEEEVESIES